MLYGNDFSADIGGTSYSARYHVSGKKVIVVSIYGERGAPLGKDKPLTVAQRLLNELVQRRLAEKEALSHA